MLKDAAFYLLSSGIVQISADDVDNARGLSLDQTINNVYVRHFCNRYSITYRVRSGNISLSKAVVSETNKRVAFQLGCLKTRVRFWFVSVNN